VKAEGIGRELKAFNAGEPGAGRLIIDFDIGMGEGTVRRDAR